jgi:hypothetical protein
MTTASVGVERRAGQRFPFLLPVSFRAVVTGVEGVGFTQDLSSRGVFFFTDAPLQEGAEIELTLTMPSEITLGESMRVRCRGHILRVTKPANGMTASHGQECGVDAMRHAAPETAHPETKIAVAVLLEGYEYLPNPSGKPIALPRVAALHPQRDEDLPQAPR